MKSILIAATAILLAGPALAQSSSVTTTTRTQTTTISPAEQTEIQQYVVKEHHESVQPPPQFTMAPGAVVPGTVELYAFPPAAPYAHYRYAMIGGQTVVVDPVTRQVVEVIH
jgi:Protein of unknown function (DUF1236)